jgi:hypothetical protein
MDNNKAGEGIWNEWKETAFHSWHSDNDQGDDKILDDQNDSEEAKTIFM